MKSIAHLLPSLQDLARSYRQCGHVVTITQRPLQPLAMGHHEDVVSIRPLRGAAPEQQADPGKGLAAVYEESLRRELAAYREALAPYRYDTDEQACAKIRQLVRDELARRNGAA